MMLLHERKIDRSAIAIFTQVSLSQVGSSFGCLRAHDIFYDTDRKADRQSVTMPHHSDRAYHVGGRDDAR
jgi:hypothetical protein